MKNSILGYIVVFDTEGEPLELGDHSGYPHKVLLRGDDVSVFKTRKEARQAIESTKEWIETNRGQFGDEWAVNHRFSIWRLRMAG